MKYDKDMQTIGETMNRLDNRHTKKKGGIVGPRHEMIVAFTDRLNGLRKQDGFKSLPYPAVAKKLEHLSTAELYPFFRQCENAKHFGKYFWYSLKVK